MNSPSRPWLGHFAAFTAGLLTLAGAIPRALPDGIPEPSIVLYGEVRSGSDAHRITRGILEWTFRPAGGGEPVRVTAQLTNVLGQFSYVLLLPCETAVAGMATSSNTLALGPLNRSFDRSLVTLEGAPIQLALPASYQWVLSSKDRGRIERVDLTVMQALPDTDRDGLPDWWESLYCGCSTCCSPDDDLDQDGLTNLEEYRAGTDPTQLSLVVEVLREGQPGPRLTWNSVHDRTYTILRADRLTPTLSGFAPIRTGVMATAPRNTFIDNDPLTGSERFYLIRLDP